ncbi:MAG: peptidoglycan-associated lipoprotein Pal [Pseudomonadales bacterium]|nr:peptidoglycan-associated lipoprotein Pal [Pseudomonadales bacterium]
MGNTGIRGLLIITLAGLLLAGCKTDSPEGTAEVTPLDTDTSSGSAAIEDTSSNMTVKRPPSINSVTGDITIFDEFDENKEETLSGVFYFDFDQAIVKRLGHEELDKHATTLKENRSYRVRLEGHADQRGTREYNLALGERRGNAVRAYLVAQGVSRRQVEVVSLGEEKPADLGTGESAWAKNRRVEFKYRQ